MPKRKTLKRKKMYEVAYGLAQKAHKGQKRHDGRTPYFEHVKEVASKVHGWGLKTVAILHDTIEDTEITAESLLREGFPKPIVQAVVALTKAPGTKDYLGEIRRKVLPNKFDRPVKLADNHANMRDRVTQFLSGGKDAEKARKKLHDYARSIALLTAKKR